MADHQVILTFDDGPSETASVDDQILDVLKQRRVKACFCLLTYKLKGNGRMLKRIVDEGHTIAFHSRTHEEYLTKTFQQFKDEIQEFETILRKETGIELKVKYFRPPVGVISVSLLNELRSSGIKILYATHYPTDTFVNRASSLQYIQGLIQKFEDQKGGIMVLHNGSELFPRPSAEDFTDESSAANRLWIPDALDLIIDRLRDRGFQFMGLEEIQVAL